MENVINLINSLKIYNDDYVILACSYGPDSMCLLDVLQKLNLNIVVAHVNHKLRKEADQEYTLLKEYCHQNHLIFEGTEITKYGKGNIEAFARNFRYHFFKELINKYHAKYLFTAHHGDDLVETIIMRIARGSSFKGYAGFTLITHNNNYDIIRPLIYLTKDEIIKYDQDNNIPYALDKSNDNEDYTRNKIRHQILPILKEINPKIHTKFIKLSNTINEYNDYIQKEADTYYQNLYLNNSLDLNEFNILPFLIKKEILNKILLSLYKEDINKITDKHLNLLFNLIDSEKQNGFINLPNKMKVSKFYNILEFKTPLNIDLNYDYLFKEELNLPIGVIKKITTTDIIKSNYLIRLNSEEFSLPIHVRTRRNGDKIETKNLNGLKKINEIFIDNKLSKKERDIFPIVTDNKDNILWIPGLKKSKFDKQINERYDIILKYIKKGENNEKQ
jgi:tRNA(Ile)-lysidine synthetase-like protein